MEPKSSCRRRLPSPRLQLRSAFEALLTIEYVTEADTLQRAYAYLVTDVHRLFSTYRRWDPRPPQGEEARQRWREDVIVTSAKLPIEDTPDLKTRIGRLEGLLQKPRWREADQEFQTLKKSIHKRPPWYCLYGGPKNLERLAAHLKRSYQYEILYREWSQTAHAEDLSRQLTKDQEGDPATRRLRDPSEIQTTIDLSVGFALAATRRILTHYRDGELPAFAQWYLREVRAGWMKISGRKPRPP